MMHPAPALTLLPLLPLPAPAWAPADLGPLWCVILALAWFPVMLYCVGLSANTICHNGVSDHASARLCRMEGL